MGSLFICLHFDLYAPAFEWGEWGGESSVVTRSLNCNPQRPCVTVLQGKLWQNAACWPLVLLDPNLREEGQEYAFFQKSTQIIWGLFKAWDLLK